MRLILKTICYFYFLILLFSICCQKKDNNFKEFHRKLALQEILSEYRNNKEFTNIFKGKFSISDSSNIDEEILEYLRINPELPGYIKKALVKKYLINMMTFEEFLLIKKDLLNNYVCVVHEFQPDKVIVGNKACYDPKKNNILSGNVWIFKYGFLWEWGVI